MKQWIITATESEKVGYYFFGGFRNYKAIWEGNWCRCGKTKIYKSASAVRKNINRLKAIFPNLNLFVTEIGEGTTGVELNIYWSDGCTIETRDFVNKEDAETYCKDKGIIDYNIKVQKRKV